MRDEAASPIVVLATFVGAAVLITMALVWIFDEEPRDMDLQRRDAEAPYLEVTHAQGGIRWDDLDVRFLDRAGTDHSGNLVLPSPGAVEPGDMVTFRFHPAGGTYLLVMSEGGTDVVRMTLRF